MPSVWVDLSNSPHIPFFRPVVTALEDEGVEVMLTARDFSQTVPLAREVFGERVTVVGSWGRGRAAKTAAVATRASALRRHVRRRAIDLAVSHNSYAQLVAARSLGLRTVTFMDYEHQPANHLAFRLAHTVAVPAVFPASDLRRCGARHVRRYPGLKEQVYLTGARPAIDVRAWLDAGDRVVVILRPPPDFAAYHRFDNPLFGAAVDRVVAAPDTVPLLLPRTPAQAATARERWGNRVVIPDRVFDTLDLLAAADAVVGAGGTMNREAAVLGVPVWTLYAGAPSAVDRFLVERGRLHVVETGADLDRLVLRRRRAEVDAEASRETLDAVVGIVRDELPSR